MNIKKQIILDDKDYERLVHDVNLSDDEIKSRIANALTTDMVFSFDFDVNKKVTGNMRIESAIHNLGYNEYDNIVRARDENIHHAVYTAIRVENLRDWGEQWKALAKDLFNELLEIDSDNTIDSYLSYEALEKIKEHFKNQ